MVFLIFRFNANTVLIISECVGCCLSLTLLLPGTKSSVAHVGHFIAYCLYRLVSPLKAGRVHRTLFCFDIVKLFIVGPPALSAVMNAPDTTSLITIPTPTGGDETSYKSEERYIITTAYNATV